VSNPTAKRPTGRVLLGITGEGEDWSELRDHLGDVGWKVEPFDATVWPDQAGPESALPRLAGVDLAVLVVGRPEGHNERMTLQSLAHLTGLLQGHLGYRRVLVLVENEVDALLRGTGVSELSYERGDIRSRFAEIDAHLSESTSPPARLARSGATPLLGRFGRAESQVAPEVWMVLGVLAVAAALVGVIGYQIVAGPVTGESASEQISATAANADDAVAGPTVSDTSPVPVEPDPATDPDFGAEGGRVDGLPATCVVDTPPGDVLELELSCEGVGGLRSEGFLGPWHSEISAISVDAGVVGDVLIESPSASESVTLVPLEPLERQSLESYDSLIGVEQIVLEFSANNQQVTLYQRSDRGGRELILTFSLDL